VPINYGIHVMHAPAALGAFLVSVLVLAPESLGATRAALANQLQRSVNLLLGSVLASISLTIPAVLAIGFITDQTIVLGLDAADMTLLVLTLAVSTLTFARPPHQCVARRRTSAAVRRLPYADLRKITCSRLKRAPFMAHPMRSGFPRYEGEIMSAVVEHGHAAGDGHGHHEGCSGLMRWPARQLPWEGADSLEWTRCRRRRRTTASRPRRSSSLRPLLLGMRDLPQQLLELRANALQLLPMHLGELLEDPVALRRQAQIDLAAVLRRRLARDQPLFGQAVDQADRGVVPDHQLLRQVIDREPVSLRTGAQGEQRLVILGGEAAFFRLDLGKTKERAQRVAKRGKPLIFVRVQLQRADSFFMRHYHVAYRVSQHT
jgi:hypothetical protein